MKKLSLALLLLIPLSVFAFAPGDTIHYSISVTNSSPDALVANGQAVLSGQTMVVSEYNDVLDSDFDLEFYQPFLHSVIIRSNANVPLCEIHDLLKVDAQYLHANHEVTSRKTINCAYKADFNQDNGNNYYLNVTVG